MIRFPAIILILLIMLIGGLSVFFVLDYQKALEAPVTLQEEIIFTIEPGSSLKQIAGKLEREGIIASALYFQVFSWQKGLQNAFQAGEYKLKGEISMHDAAYQIASGQAANREVKVLIREGESVAAIAQTFAELDMFSENDFFSAAGFPKVDYRTAQNYPRPLDYAEKYSVLEDKPKYYGYEGYLFPDTYLFFKDSTPEGAVLKMLDNFDKKLNEEMRAEINKQGKTVFEIVTMASLLEKEVRTEEDMKIVSGIFWDRIKIGQPLQSCATLAYILGVQKAQYSLDDTNIESPYNTYRNQGLPPSPINNPGLRAIKAAVYPTYTDYNYFLSAPDGTTIYAETYDEHVRNKAIYLK